MGTRLDEFDLVSVSEVSSSSSCKVLLLLLLVLRLSPPPQSAPTSIPVVEDAVHPDFPIKGAPADESHLPIEPCEAARRSDCAPSPEGEACTCCSYCF